MKKILYSTALALLESIAFIAITNILEIEYQRAIELLIVYLMFMFMFKHFAFHSTLIWEEIKNISQASFLYLVSIIILEENTHLEGVITSFIIVCCMFFVSIYLNRMLRIKCRRWLSLRTIVIGDEKEALRYQDITVNNRFAITNVVGIIKLPFASKGSLIDDNKNSNLKVYNYEQLEHALQSGNIDQLVIIPPENDHKMADSIMQNVNDRVERIKVCVNGSAMITHASEVQDFDGLLLVSTLLNRYHIIKSAYKRSIDILAGIVGCILVVPLALYVKTKYIKNGDRESIFFTQERIGLNGKSIKIYKFRTMIPNAEEELDELMKANTEIAEEYKRDKKIKNDPRITKVGDKLRSTSLDEFPQFINVLKGEMSLVGPRPYLFREKEDMGEYYSSIILSKPGITGMWQANGRSDVSFEVRCKLDQHYYNNWTPYMDFIIIYKTIKGVIYGKGAM